MVNKHKSVTDEKMDGLFGALANAKRREIVFELSFRPATVSQLAIIYQLSLPSIHKHIRILEKAKLVRRQKVGRVNFVAIDRSGLRRLQAWSVQFNTEWGNGQETLENYIARLHQ